jgi:hypothetical protein
MTGRVPRTSLDLVVTTVHGATLVGAARDGRDNPGWPDLPSTGDAELASGAFDATACSGETSLSHLQFDVVTDHLFEQLGEFHFGLPAEEVPGPGSVAH